MSKSNGKNTSTAAAAKKNEEESRAARNKIRLNNVIFITLCCIYIVKQCCTLPHLYKIHIYIAALYILYLLRDLYAGASHCFILFHIFCCLDDLMGFFFFFRLKCGDGEMFQ